MSSPWLTTPPTDAHRAAFADAEVVPFWQTTVDAREPHPPLEQVVDAELCIVGGGYTGLWAALYAKEQDPQREVVVLEGMRCGAGASSRNGGFLNYSLTHGIENGHARFEHDMPAIERLAHENFSQLHADLVRYGSDGYAEYEATGELDVALSPDDAEALKQSVGLYEQFGTESLYLDRDQLQSEIHSPLYYGGAWQKQGAAVVNPAKLADALRQAALKAGVTIHEHTQVNELRKSDRGIDVVSGSGIVKAAKVLLATSAYEPLDRTVKLFVAPVYDYALMTEPLTEQQLDSIGWKHRQGVGDCGNQFHYYRLSADNRILWGGFDAVYRYGGPVGPHLDGDDHTFLRLSQNFFTNFPQLEGLKFTNRWGGAIDTCSRFSVFFHRSHGGRVVYAGGYTGLGVGATRFGGRTGVDLLDGRGTPATELDLVRKRPVPFPPEPLRSAVIQFTRNRMAAEDRTGKRGLWLRTLDAAGLGFDS
jgi:glycine/D-amino acid oxidase-like deaminating enzyme